ncbi:MAG TPA: PIN domain-containing protein [Acidimicrobiales bacterium]|nr:PIN domain-containing protein [Acidimicrobiales bacterium]
MNAVLDTSVIVSADAPPVGDDDLFVTAVTFAELHAGVLRATTDTDRARRLRRLTRLAALYDPLPLDAGVATAYGRIAALAEPRRDSNRPRTMDLLVAATALANGCRLYTCDPDRLEGLDGVLEVIGV